MKHISIFLQSTSYIQVINKGISILWNTQNNYTTKSSTQIWIQMFIAQLRNDFKKNSFLVHQQESPKKIRIPPPFHTVRHKKCCQTIIQDKRVNKMFVDSIYVNGFYSRTWEISLHTHYLQTTHTEEMQVLVVTDCSLTHHIHRHAT